MSSKVIETSECVSVHARVCVCVHIKPTNVASVLVCAPDQITDDSLPVTSLRGETFSQLIWSQSCLKVGIVCCSCRFWSVWLFSKRLNDI